MSDDFFGGISNAVGSVTGAIGQTVGSAVGATVNTLGTIAQGTSAGISGLLQGASGTNPNRLASLFRSAGIPSGAELNNTFSPTSAQFSTRPESKDWRVSISHDMIYYDQIFSPLANTGGMIFPYTPQITMSHTANYETIPTVHTNYPFYAYKNSQIDDISITGKFTVADQSEAVYWLVMMHFLRTVTKMYFGQGPNLGNPPPICTLNGYGDFVYNNVSVVVKNFTIQLSDDVDYIAASLTDTLSVAGASVSYVPVFSTVTVQLAPVYSREKIKSFNLTNFARGQLVTNTGGRKGFI